jgi:hypothetical protein
MHENEILITEKFIKLVEEIGVSDEFLVQICELSGSYLNLKSISNYAKADNMSYNGVKKYRKIITVFNTKYVIDNE